MSSFLSANENHPSISLIEVALRSELSRLLGENPRISDVDIRLSRYGTHHLVATLARERGTHPYTVDSERRIHPP